MANSDVLPMKENECAQGQGSRALLVHYLVFIWRASHCCSPYAGFNAKRPYCTRCSRLPENPANTLKLRCKPIRCPKQRHGFLVLAVRRGTCLPLVSKPAMKRPLRTTRHLRQRTFVMYQPNMPQYNTIIQAYSG